MNMPIRWRSGLVALTLSMCSGAHADVSFSMLRKVIDPDVTVSKNCAYVIADDGFKVVQCFPEEHGVILRCGRPTDEKVGLAFWMAIAGEEFTRFAPNSAGEGCQCYLRDLPGEYVSGQTIKCGIFEYYGTETFRLEGGGSLTLKGFRPVPKDVEQAVRKAMAESAKQEERLAEQEAAKYRDERKSEQRMIRREGEIRNEVCNLRKQWKSTEDANVARETNEALCRERVSLRFPDCVDMPSICGFKIGMSRGDAHDFIEGDEVYSEKTEDLVTKEAYRTKKKFSIFKGVELIYHDASHDLQFCVVKSFKLFGYADLEKYSSASCNEEYFRVRELLQQKLRIKFDRPSSDDRCTYCRAEFGSYLDKRGLSRCLAHIELRMENSENNKKEFSVKVIGADAFIGILRKAERKSQDLAAAARDREKASLKPAASEDEAFE